MRANLKVACVGTGYFSKFHYEAWHQIDTVELVASVSLSIQEAKATGLPAFTDLPEMLEQSRPDLLDIITPPPTHTALIKSALGSTVQTIICQKPFCQSIEEAQELSTLCEKAGVQLIVHENFRFQPWYRAMKEAIEQGLVGEVQQLTFRLRTGDGQGPNAYMDRQPYFQKMEKFLIHETGVHWIDTFKYLLGQPIAVYADLRQLNPHISGEDAGYFIMEFENNVRALFDANRHLDHETENTRTTFGEALLEGTEGTISLNGTGELWFRAFGSSDMKLLLPAQKWPGFAGNCVYTLQKHVVSGIYQQNLIENAANEYMEVLFLEQAIYHSAETGKKVLL